MTTRVGRLTSAAVTAALVIGAAVMAGPADPAAATTVTPTARDFSAAIDALPTWERESGCSPTEKPGARYLRRLLLTTYGQISSNIVRACSGADSGHEEGRALDWMTSARVPAQKEIAEAFVAWLQAPDGFGNPEAMARRLGISYVIWNSRTWRAYDPDRGWTEYSRCLHKKMKKRAFDNTCHRTHVHISFSWDGALKRTSFYTGFVACPESVPVVQPPVLGLPPYGGGQVPPPGLPPSSTTVDVDPVTGPVVALPAARILNTAHGRGTAAGPCRVHPGVPFDLPVLGVGGVPVSGVAAVQLKVRLGRPDAPAELRAWPTGTPETADAVAMDETGRVAVVTVPVGASGQVTLALDGAMAHLRADVLGYVPAPPVGVPPPA